MSLVTTAPEGHKQLKDIEVWESPTEIIILGEPSTEGLTEDEAVELHNCDAMGCGWEHVIYRFKKEQGVR